MQQEMNIHSNVFIENNQHMSSSTTQTMETFSRKSNPSFAETQLLSVYYPSLNPRITSKDDKCILIERQDRSPTSSNRTSLTKSTQTVPLTSQGSTVLIEGNSPTNSFIKLHSGTQRLPDNYSTLTNDSFEQTRYSYEEYLVPYRENSTENNQTRVSSWPPVPDEVQLELNNTRPSRVQFAENLVEIIPVSAQSSIVDEQTSPPPVRPRTNVNQSSWIKSHMEQTDIEINSMSNRVEKLRSFFEQPVKHTVEVRFQVNDPTIHRAKPVRVIDETKFPFNIEQIETIIGKLIINLDDIGHYLSDGRTWQWNEVFWLSLTTTQRDQLKELEQQTFSRRNSVDTNLSTSSSSATTATTTTTTIIEQKPQENSTNNTSTSTRSSSIDSLLNQSKRTDSQLTIVESGYDSSDDHTKYRPNSQTIHEEPIIDLLSYEQFIHDYLSKYAKQLLSTDDSLILHLDQQQISFPHIPFTTSSMIYFKLINSTFPPYETNSNELVVFLADHILHIPSDRWLNYRTKYQQTKWVQNLKKINSDIPRGYHSLIRQWISEHIIISIEKQQLQINDRIIPIIRKPLNSNQIFEYLLDIGSISYDEINEKISIANHELDFHLIERLTTYLRLLDQIYFDQQKQQLIFNEQFHLSYEHIQHLFINQDNLNTQQLARLLIEICDITEDQTHQGFIIKYQNQILRLNHCQQTHIQFLTQWLEQLNSQEFIQITDENNILIYPEEQDKQIVIQHEHVESYMKTKSESESTIRMSDIAEILLFYNYVQYKSGQFVYGNQSIQLDSDEFVWLQTTIQTVEIHEQRRETIVELFDGQRKQSVQIPFEYLSPTKNSRSIAEYLVHNGNVRCDTQTGHYTYEYHQDVFSTKDKEDFIDSYVEYINNHDGVKFDNTKNVLVLENPIDRSELYLTCEHSDYIRENHYRRRDMKYILNEFSQIRQDEYKNWLLYYNNQCLEISSYNQTKTQPEISRQPTNVNNLKLIFPSNKSQRSIEKTASNTTLDIEPATEQNQYAVDPLLTLTNYIYRHASIYQDRFGRLIIKIHQDEIVVPYKQAAQSIDEINRTPHRTGSIITRLIQRIGQIQRLSPSGDIRITIGNNSIDIHDQQTLKQSKSSSSLASTSSNYLKQRLIIIYDDNHGRIKRFYLQFISTNDNTASQPQLIHPECYTDTNLRDAEVYVYYFGDRDIRYENLAEYLSHNPSDLSSSLVRRMLKFTSDDEYFDYLNEYMSTDLAEEFISENEHYSTSTERSSYLTNIRRSPQTSNGQGVTTPEKNVTLPRSTTLSGQSNDGESDGRTTVSRSASTAAKVVTSKSDTLKSTTSSSAASSRETSPNRTNGSKGGGDEVKKEKKSKFRTPSFLRKRKEKKEAAAAATTKDK